MKTRIIQTRFYKDGLVAEMDLLTQHLFMYLLTCEHINISGIFELPDRYIMLESKLTPRQLEAAKTELEGMGRVKFYEGWVYVVNAEKNNAYRNSPKNESAYQKELKKIPDEVKGYFFDTTIDSSIDTSMDTSHKSKIINHKSEIRNQKPEIRKNEIEKIISTWNSSMGTNISSSRAWAANFLKWREDFTLEKIVQAVKSIPRHEWLKDKATPVIFFRTDKDWIDQCLNLGAAPGKPADIPTDFY